MTSAKSVIVACGLLAIVLGACDPGGARPTASSSPTPSRTTAAKPNLTDTAAKLSVPGAKAFAKYYYDAAMYARDTGDTSIVDPLTLPGCKECARLWDKAASARFRPDANVYATSDDESVKFEGNQAKVDVSVDAMPGQKTKKQQWVDDVELIYAAGTWKVKEIEPDEYTLPDQ